MQSTTHHVTIGFYRDTCSYLVRMSYPTRGLTDRRCLMRVSASRSSSHSAAKDEACSKRAPTRVRVFGDPASFPPDRAPANRPAARRTQSYTSKGIWRQGIGSFVRKSYVQALCPVVLCPYLCTYDARLSAVSARFPCLKPASSGFIYNVYIYIYTL